MCNTIHTRRKKCDRKKEAPTFGFGRNVTGYLIHCVSFFSGGDVYYAYTRIGSAPHPWSVFFLFVREKVIEILG